LKNEGKYSKLDAERNNISKTCLEINNYNFELSMQFVGFLKEQDRNIIEARSIEQMLQPQNISDEERNAIIRYLECGIFLCGVMSFIYDDDGMPIGSLDYFTDGEFVWPVYFPYYLKKYHDFYIDKLFIESVSKKNYQIGEISTQELDELEKLFDKEWAGK
jgi:hypothetical protein